jgi:hypothetical protein
MRSMLLAAAALAAVVLPAPALAEPAQPFVGFVDARPSGGVQVNVGTGFADYRFDRVRRRGGGDFGIWVNGGEWARHNNRAFESDSYNDWWHDQPWRSQPAWVRNNQGCRQYWSGGGWRC